MLLLRTLLCFHTVFWLYAHQIRVTRTLSEETAGVVVQLVALYNGCRRICTVLLLTVFVHAARAPCNFCKIQIHQSNGFHGNQG